MEKSVEIEARAMLHRKADVRDVIVSLYNSRATIIETIRIVAEETGMRLADAKSLVSSQPCWREVAQAGDVLHEELARELNDAGGTKSG